MYGCLLIHRVESLIWIYCCVFYVYRCYYRISSTWCNISTCVAFQNHTDVFFQPMLYFIGHMSKFAKTGARRLKSHVTGLYREGGMTYSGAVPGEVPVATLPCTNTKHNIFLECSRAVVSFPGVQNYPWNSIPYNVRGLYKKALFLSSIVYCDGPYRRFLCKVRRVHLVRRCMYVSPIGLRYDQRPIKIGVFSVFTCSK